MSSQQNDTCIYVALRGTRAVLFRLFPKMINLPPKPVGFRLTFIQ